MKRNENCNLSKEISYVEKTEGNIDKPATVMPQNENGFPFLQALHFQNPLKLQQVLVLYARL